MFESRRRRSGSKPEYIDQYFTTEALGDGTFSFTKKGTGDNIQYSKDNGSTWTPLASNETINVVSGDKVMWKSTITPSNSIGIGTFSSSNKFNASGNIMSLLYGDDFKEQTSLEGKDYALASLFQDNSGLIGASNLMLPATTLALGCYGNMFNGCTNLIEAPELSATTLADNCYIQMFSGCTSLNHIIMLATTPARFSFTNWVYNVSSAGTFVKHPDMDSLPIGADGIPEGWTVIDASV